ncbi:TetR family transcriptional regulator [Fontibacillus phaseoli]|uniref:TetR family transcriptional regulator n=1 Tax=Fontibacillus phaseoli TaxID=1416533 RepID=A0A369BDU5_9BACL|nr:TetR/AcrR family transcriptional regulator [Fontibacillus phaseoli]RCX19723.1 TetR family transcriptional regulator [Fontibacillus phaseoli]
MPKQGMEPVRRAETMNATLECIYEHGIERITLDMVAAKAGFSKGIVAYYFKSKKNLILESLKAFLSAYSQKISSSIQEGMPPLEMVSTVVEVALPPVSDTSQETIQVSTLEGAEHIRLPQERIAKIFIQFISMAAIDEDLRKVMLETYAQDIEGISSLIRHARKADSISELDDKHAAYALLAMIYGLSFFRTHNFMPVESTDNRDIAFDFIHRLFGA